MSQILKNVKKKLNIITLRNEDKKDKKEDKEDKDKQKYLFNEFINMSITIFEDMLNKNKFDKTNSLVVGNTYLNNMIELLSNELKEGDLIVLDGLTKVHDGAEVMFNNGGVSSQNLNEQAL
jgi:hypothetical protein